MESAQKAHHRVARGESLAFSDVHAPGCYVAKENGDLFRVPDEALREGHSPQIEIVSKPPKVVTKIANDPWTPISKARQLAADADHHVH